MSWCSIKHGSDNAVKAKCCLEAKGITDCDVVVAEKNQIFIDYDVEVFPLERFQTALSFLEARLEKARPFTWEKYRSKSGKHWHVLINLPIEMSELERITWQSIFGSDFKRDALSTISIARDVKNPILLFMKQDRKPEDSGTSDNKKPTRKFRNASKT